MLGDELTPEDWIAVYTRTFFYFVGVFTKCGLVSPHYDFISLTGCWPTTKNVVWDSCDSSEAYHYLSTMYVEDGGIVGWLP